MSDSLVSVVMTCYNQEQWVEQSIESVLAQSYQNWELIAIDNGSTDRYSQTIEQYRRHPQVTAIRYERNTPITTILNHGIRTAHSRYFSLRYADDYYLSHKLKRQVAVFEELPTEYGVVCSTGYRLIGAPPPPASGPETPVEADPDAAGLTT